MAKINITTQGPQFYNDSLKGDSSTLVLNMWNLYGLIKIHPKFNKKTNDGKMYDYDNGATITLSLKNLFNLRKGVKLIKKKDSTIKSISVQIKEKIIEVSKDKYPDLPLAIAIFEVDGKKRATDAIYYGFNKNTDDDVLFIDYDETTGKLKTKKVNPEFELFELWLDSAINGLLAVQNHSAVSQTIFSTNKLETKLDANGGGSSYRKSKTSFGGGGVKKRNLGISNEDLDDDEELEELKEEEVETEEIDDVDEITKLMEEDEDEE